MTENDNGIRAAVDVAVTVADARAEAARLAEENAMKVARLQAMGTSPVGAEVLRLTVMVEHLLGGDRVWLAEADYQRRLGAQLDEAAELTNRSRLIEGLDDGR